ncbi:MAG: DNA replication/repair protein RecF [Actinomycetota bacterium]|nr:DNA replication/repair protein RecF [Actinomycetota bacterium]
MRLVRLWLTDYRNYASATLDPAPEGVTVVVGGNGDGKTNLIEAVAYLATLSSFRGAPAEALVRHGRPCAVVRGEVDRGGRTTLVEVEVQPGGGQRRMVNRQPLRRGRDLLGAFQVTVFSPDDLALVKGGPAERRRYLDDLLSALRPGNEAIRGDVERVLRQRNALLRQAGGRLTPDVAATLDVWDAKLSTAGEALAEAREELVAALEAEVGKAYGELAGGGGSEVSMAYRRSWEGPLSAALAGAREEDLRRAVTTVGPHRDELEMVIAAGGPSGPVSLPARTHASQGEQRSLALALRLGGHAVATDSRGTPPVLLLDDVFSELDQARGQALLAHLPEAQVILTTTGPLPPGVSPALTVRAGEGLR